MNELLQQWLGGEHDGWTLGLMFLIETGLKGAALLVIAALIALALRKSSAAARHVVWTVALLSLIALPAALALAPHWELPVIQPAKPVSKSPAPRILTDADSIPIPERSQPRPSPERVDPVEPGNNLGHQDPGRSQEANAVRVANAIGVNRIAANPPRRLGWPYALLALWYAIALALVARVIFGMTAMRRALRRADEFPDGALAVEARSILKFLGIRRRVLLLQGEAGAMPIAAGILRTDIVLPLEAADWPVAKMRAVLAHELAHIKRRDCLTQALGRIAVAVHWFNPLAWFALRRARDEQERACDDAALQAGAAPTEYAGVLVEVARAAMREPFLGAAAIGMARRGSLETRVAAILDARRNRRGVARFAAITGMVVIGLVALVLASLKATRAETFSLAYEKPVKLRGLRGNVAGHTFKVGPIARRGADGELFIEDGKGNVAGVLGTVEPEVRRTNRLHMIVPDIANWLDQANIFFYETETDSPRYEIVEARVFDHATRDRIKNENGRIGFGFKILNSNIVQLRSAGAPLPPHVDLWFRVALYDDNRKTLALTPTPGATAAIGPTTVSLDDLRDGRPGYNTAGGTVNWTPLPQDSAGSSFVLSARGSVLADRYEITAVDRDGLVEFPTSSAYLGPQTAPGEKVVVQFDSTLKEIQSLQLRPEGPQQTFFFDNIRLPRTAEKPLPPAPSLILKTANLNSEWTTASLGPIEVRASMDDGETINGIGSSGAGRPYFIQMSPPVDPGKASTFRILIDGMKFEKPAIEMFDAQGAAIPPRGGQNGYGYMSAGAESGSGIGFRSHVSISEIAQVQIRFTADSNTSAKEAQTSAATEPKDETIVATTPNPFVVRAASRNTKEGAPTWVDGNGAALAEAAAADDLGKQGNWLDIANIHLSYKTTDDTRPAPAIETMQVWAYESGGKPLDLGGGRIGVGIKSSSPIGGSLEHYHKYRGTYTAMPDETIQLRSAGKSLPESVNVWTKAAIHDDPTKIGVIAAMPGLVGKFGNRNVRVLSNLDIEAPVSWFAQMQAPGQVVTFEWDADPDGAPFRVSYMGARGRQYAIDPEVRNGDKRWQGRRLTLRFDSEVDGAGWFEFWPAIEPKHYSFNDVKLPAKTFALESPRELEFVGKGNPSPDELFRMGPDTGFDLKPLRVTLQGASGGSQKIQSWVGLKTGLILPFQSEAPSMLKGSTAIFTIEGMKFAHPYIHLRAAAGKTFEPGKEGQLQLERSDRGTGIVLSTEAALDDVAMYVLSFDWEPGDALPGPWLR